MSRAGRRRRSPARGGPALNTTGLKHGDGDADLFRTIRQGVQGTQMPPYKGLRDEQVWQLVSYIRSLQNTAASHRRRARRRPFPKATLPPAKHCSSERQDAPAATRSTRAAA